MKAVLPKGRAVFILSINYNLQVMETSKKSLGQDGLVSVTRSGNTLVLKDESGEYTLLELVGGGGSADFSKLILNIDGSLVYTLDGIPSTKI